MQILSIGNSFSQDAHRWLQKLAQAHGVEMELINLFVPGCSLEMHWNNVQSNEEAYDLEPNGNPCERKISILEALRLRAWDVITVQQVSSTSGIYESYEPYLSQLVELVKKECPAAKLYFHQTWAYETDATHSSFVKYNQDQGEMYRRIKETSEIAAASIGAALIPAGEVIQTLRDTVPEFDYQNGGLSLCRDGFHLSLDYGRFAAAATWLRTIAGQEIAVVGFEDFDPALLQKIIQVVNAR